MKQEIQTYHQAHSEEDQKICNRLYALISEALPEAENKIWHAHPVWFIEGNPIVGYSKLKGGLRMMFWSGADFNEDTLKPGTGKFKDASILYTDASQIEPELVNRWLQKAKTIQWDYKNLIKRKGMLVKLEVHSS